MNQILVTQKLYVTPELRRKRKIYKIEFALSLIVIFFLSSYYIYADYDRNKSEQVSQEILAQMDYKNQKEDTTMASKDSDILVVAIDEEEPAQPQQEETPAVAQNTGNTGENAAIMDMTEAILEIPSLGIEYPVLSEQSDELLKISLNKYWGPKPNEVGNYCIVGHNYKNGKMFGKLNQIQTGNTIKLTDNSGRTLTYAVYNKYVVDPDDRNCTSQLTGGYKEVTLITCTNYGQQRLVVKCREVR